MPFRSRSQGKFSYWLGGIVTPFGRAAWHCTFYIRTLRRSYSRSLLRMALHGLMMDPMHAASSQCRSKTSFAIADFLYTLTKPIFFASSRPQTKAAGWLFSPSAAFVVALRSKSEMLILRSSFPKTAQQAPKIQSCGYTTSCEAKPSNEGAPARPNKTAASD